MDSPFVPLLTTNYVPTEQEAGIIAQLLVAPQNELYGLNVTIHHLENQLSHLRNRREHLQTAVDAHRAMVSCARRIPDEILQEIFVNTLPEAYLPQMSSTSVPMVLTHVCRRWRTLAFANTRLWAGLHISELPDRKWYQARRERKLIHIREWLSRARTTPIHLSFEWEEDIRPAFSSICAITPQPRWGGLRTDLGITSQVTLPYLTGVKINDKTPIQQLEKIHLIFGVLAGEEGYKKQLTTLNLSGNPHLTSLSLISTSSSPSFDITPYIPCANLRYLDLGVGMDPDFASRISLSSLVKILQQCPNLRVFKAPLDLMGNTPVDLSPLQPGEQLIHAGIREISLTLRDIVGDGRQIGDLVPPMFPALSALHLLFEEEWHERDPEKDLKLPDLSQSLQASSLTALALHPMTLPQSDFMILLDGLPNLVQLHLLKVGNEVDIERLYDADVVRFLSPAQPDEPEGEVHGCPHLQYLKLEKNSLSFDDEILPGLLFNRPVPLKQCHIHFGWPRDQAEFGLEDFDVLRAGGLDLQLRYGTFEVYRSRSTRDFNQTDSLLYGWDVEL
jgi:hypothetical protein